MSDVDVLLVGPAGHETGGIARYMAEQQSVLPGRVRTRVFDVATPRGDGIAWAMRALGTAVGDALRFPFRRRPDIVHVHTSHYFSFYLSAFYVLFAALVWRSRVVLHVHGSSFDEFVVNAGRTRAVFQSLVFGRVDGVVVLSEYWSEILSPRVPESKLHVIPNAISPAEYTPRYDVEPPRVTFVSNHIERKGVVEFVEAVDTVLADAPSVALRVTIAGSGPLSDRAASLAERRESVSYLGYVSEAEKRRILDESSIFVLPTYAEGLPIAMLEAMAGGNAIVSTAVGSIPDVLTDDHGILVEPGDTEALATAIESLLTDRTRTERLARANRRLIEAEYSWESVGRQLVSLYDQLLAREGRGHENVDSVSDFGRERKE
jgi:glycosyltransferase involved in cell wall biosynthesis